MDDADDFINGCPNTSTLCVRSNRKDSILCPAGTILYMRFHELTTDAVTNFGYKSGIKKSFIYHLIITL